MNHDSTDTVGGIHPAFSVSMALIWAVLYSVYVVISTRWPASATAVSTKKVVFLEPAAAMRTTLLFKGRNKIRWDTKRDVGVERLQRPIRLVIEHVVQHRCLGQVLST